MDSTLSLRNSKALSLGTITKMRMRFLVVKGRFRTDFQEDGKKLLPPDAVLPHLAETLIVDGHNGNVDDDPHAAAGQGRRHAETRRERTRE